MPVLQSFFYSIAITLGSWTVGLLVNSVLSRQVAYERFSNLNFVRSNVMNRVLGVALIKWGATRTFFRHLNPAIQLNGSAGLARLRELRVQMTHAEIGHLIAFVAVLIFAIGPLCKGQVVFAGSLMVVNGFLNLNPALLQQQNKRRIDRLIARCERHERRG